MSQQCRDKLSENSLWLPMYFFFHDRWCLLLNLLFTESTERQSSEDWEAGLNTAPSPADHTSPPTACKAFSDANHFWGGPLFAPIWRPSNGTYGAPDISSRPMHVVYQPVCFVSAVIRRHDYWGVLYSQRHTVLPPPPFCAITHPHTRLISSILPPPHGSLAALPHC